MIENEFLVMVDCEMTGVDYKNDLLLQIAALQMIPETTPGGIRFSPGKELNLFLKSDRSPKNDFDFKYLTHVYELCQKSDLELPDAKKRFESFLLNCQIPLGKGSPVGNCIATDLMFLYEKGILERSRYLEDGTELKGTMHWDYFEISSLFFSLELNFGLPRTRVRDFIRQNNLPGRHDALIDCKNQLRELNLCLDYLSGTNRVLPPPSPSPKQ